MTSSAAAILHLQLS